MKKIIKNILISAIAVFWANLIFILPANAQIDPLVVEFEKTPLFKEANFLPGDGIMRWIKVTNNSGETKKIAIEAINKSDPDNFASQLNLVIKEGAATLFSDTLKEFFDKGETYLSDLANSATTQYDLTITFSSSDSNDYQGKQLGFDILIGFQGTEGTDGGGGGGGDGLPPGLIITNETVLDVQETSVIITWLTNYNSTSQIIYGSESENHTLDLSDNAGSPPKYGYTQTTLEYDTSPKVTSHSVTITGLTPGTKYYYRAVSHASLAIGQEYTFITLTSQTAGEEGKEEPAFVPPSGETSAGEEEPSYAPGWVSAGEEEEEETVGGLERPELVEVELEEPIGLGKFLAAIGAFPFNLKVILVIVALILILLIILWLFKRKKKK